MSRHQKIVILLSGIVMLGLFLVSVFGDNGWLERHRMQAAHARLVSANETLTQEILHMYRTIDRLQTDPAFIENVARQELGMIRSDELIFKFRSDPK